MVGDGPVFQSESFHVIGDFLQAVVPVAPDRMIVQGASQVRPLDRACGRLIFFAGGKLAVVFTQFRRHKRQIQFGKNFRFVPARHEQFGIARFGFGFEQAVFIQPQTALNRALAHDDVVLLAAGEIGQGKRKFPVADHPQIALNAALKNDARLRFALGRDFDDVRLRDKEFNHRPPAFSTTRANQCRR